MNEARQEALSDISLDRIALAKELEASLSHVGELEDRLDSVTELNFILERRSGNLAECVDGAGRRVRELEGKLAASENKVIVLCKLNLHLQKALDAAMAAASAESIAGDADMEDYPQAPRVGDDMELPALSLTGGGIKEQGKWQRRLHGSSSSKTTKNRWVGMGLEMLRKRFPASAIAEVVQGIHAEISTDLQNQGKSMEQLYKRAPDKFMQLLPKGAMENAVKTGQEAYASSMYAHWSVNRCLGLKYRNRLSRGRYEDMSMMLSFDHVEGGGWQRKSFNGVMFPRLQTRYALEKAVKEIKTSTGLTAFDQGKGVTVDLRHLTQVNILESIKKHHFWVDEETATVRQFDGMHPELMNVLDSANHHKGMKVTSAGFTFPHGTEHPMSPAHTHEHAHMEGGDGNYDMATLGKPILEGPTS